MLRVPSPHFAIRIRRISTLHLGEITERLKQESLRMTFWTILFVLYAATTAFAVYSTYKEQRLQYRPSVRFNLIGYLCCAIWPIIVAVILVTPPRPQAPAWSGEPKPSNHYS